MNAHRLRSIIDVVIAEHRRLDIDHQLARILQTLEACMGNPSSEADEEFRVALTSLLAGLRNARTNDFVESDRRLLLETHSRRFTGDGLAERILTIANERPFLPGRAKALVAELAQELRAHMETLSATQAGLDSLHVGPAPRSGDAYELGILLPRTLLAGGIEDLITELRDWNQILKEFFAAVTGKPADVSLRVYSANRFELSAPLDRDGALVLGTIIAGVYEMFDRVMANRTQAAELEKLKYPGEIVSRMRGFEQQVIQREMKAIKEKLAKRSSAGDAPKRRDYDRMIDKGLRFLAVKVRDGVDLEIVGPYVAGDCDAAAPERDGITHHVRDALRTARKKIPAAPQPAPADKGDRPAAEDGTHPMAPPVLPDEPKPAHIPLSKIADPEGEGDQQQAA